MNNGDNKNISRETYETLRRDRDSWAERAMEQQQYIRQLEEEGMRKDEEIERLRVMLGIKNEDQPLFCRITQEAYDRGQAQAVENDLRSACGSAPKLIRTIRTYEALGYLDTKNLSSIELYDLLAEHFHLKFKLRTFQTYRSK